jgi:hypothetical protein
MNSFIDWLEGYLEDKVSQEQIVRIKDKFYEYEFQKIKVPDWELLKTKEESEFHPLPSLGWSKFQKFDSTSDSKLNYSEGCKKTF